ncbi:hypothetical protein ACNH6C_13740 [Bdellovibrio bacteriovorus]|uniref:hypothetical protein n=1 Tax=Bdellovibrio bacteriovorus TaxID=959 RepID=UPI003A80FA46
MSLTIWGTILIILGTALTVVDNFLTNKEQENRKTAFQPYIDQRLYTIAKAGADIRQAIYWAANTYPVGHGMYPEEAYPTEGELTEMLSKIRPTGYAPSRFLQDRNIYWAEFLNERIEISLTAMKDIQNKSDMVTVELAETILELERLKFFKDAKENLKIHKFYLDRESEYRLSGYGPITYTNGMISRKPELWEYFTAIKKFEEKFVKFPQTPNARKYAL